MASALDRIANIVRAARLVAFVLTLTVVVGSAWAIRPSDLAGSGVASQARVAEPPTPYRHAPLITDATQARLNESLQKCLVPDGFRAYRDSDGYIQVVPVSPIPNWRGMGDTRMMRCTP
jgi:hypothetical protein